MGSVGMGKAGFYVGCPKGAILLTESEDGADKAMANHSDQCCKWEPLKSMAWIHNADGRECWTPRFIKNG